MILDRVSQLWWEEEGQCQAFQKYRNTIKKIKKENIFKLLGINLYVFEKKLMIKLGKQIFDVIFKFISNKRFKITSSFLIKI